MAGADSIQILCPSSTSLPTLVTVAAIMAEIYLSCKPWLGLLVNLHLKTQAMEEPDALSLPRHEGN